MRTGEFDNNTKWYYLQDGLDNNMSIYRYMDLDFFITMMGQRKFHVSRKRTFSDMFESHLSFKKMFKFYPFRENPAIKNDSSEWRTLSEKFKGCADLLTSCWTANNNESYLMWKGYTSRMGLRIASTIDKFTNSLGQDSYRIVCGKIKYEDVNGGECLEKQLFSKNLAYASENEIRFYFVPLTQSIFPDMAVANDSEDFQICTDNLVTEVLLSPFIEHFAANQLSNFIKSEYKIENVLTSPNKIKS